MSGKRYTIREFLSTGDIELAFCLGDTGVSLPVATTEP